MANKIRSDQALGVAGIFTLVALACAGEEAVDTVIDSSRPPPRPGTVLYGVENAPLREAIGEITDLSLSDSAIFLLDARNHRVQVISPSGSLMSHYERPGRGPGEFYVPSSIAVDGHGLIHVLDRGNTRITSLKIERDSMVVVNEFGIAHDARDMCFLGDTLIVAGDHEGAILHAYSISGEHLSSFGGLTGAPASHPAEHPLYQRHFSTGVLLCQPVRDLIYFGVATHGIVRVFSRSGLEVDQIRIPDFAFLDIFTNDRGGLRTQYFNDSAYYDRIVNLTEDSSGIISVQVQSEYRPETRGRPRMEYRVHHYNHNIRSLSPPSSIDLLFYQRRGIMVGVNNDPYPQLRISSLP